MSRNTFPAPVLEGTIFSKAGLFITLETCNQEAQPFSFDKRKQATNRSSVLIARILTDQWKRSTSPGLLLEKIHSTAEGPAFRNSV